jgi:hypothetical protein
LLIAARRDAKLTQQQVVDALEKPQSFVTKYEGGERRLDVVEFVAVARAIKSDPKRLLAKLIAKADLWRHVIWDFLALHRERFAEQRAQLDPALADERVVDGHYLEGTRLPRHDRLEINQSRTRGDDVQGWSRTSVRWLVCASARTGGFCT